jgi:hypothetical protein
LKKEKKWAKWPKWVKNHWSIVSKKMVLIGEGMGSALIQNEGWKKSWAFQQFAANLAVCSVYAPKPVGDLIEKIVKTWPIGVEN